jgi:hypothetical protein
MHEIIARLPNVNEAPGARAVNLNIDLQQHYGHLFEVEYRLTLFLVN